MSKFFNYAAATNFKTSVEFAGLMRQVRRVVEADPRSNEVCDHMSHCDMFTPLFLLEGAEDLLKSLRKEEETLKALRNWKEGDAPVPLTFWCRGEHEVWARIVGFTGEVPDAPSGCDRGLVERSIREVEEMVLFDKEAILWRLKHLSINYC